MSNIIKMKMSTNPRLLKDVLTLYRSTFYALKELINNSIQANAKRIEVNLIPSSCQLDSMNYKPIERIVVFDNGDGVPFSMFEGSIMQIATENKTDGQGVGRFGALQIGQFVRIETAAYDKGEGESSFEDELGPEDIGRGWFAAYAECHDAKNGGGYPQASDEQ